MAKGRRRKTKGRRAYLKPYTGKPLNTGPAPLWRTELYHVPGLDVRAIARTTTDYRKINPVWINPEWDVKLDHHKQTECKSEKRQRFLFIVLEETRRLVTRLHFNSNDYYFEQENKVTGKLIVSCMYGDQQEATRAYDTGRILWFKGEAHGHSEVHMRTP